jgi:hypothetical protein
MNTNWQMRVVSHPSSFAVDIFIFRKVAGDRMEYVSSLSGKHGVEVTTADQGARVEPAIKLDGHCNDMLQAISDGLFSFGIKPTQQPVLQNELTATKYHLSDMRDMVCIVSGLKKGEDFGKDSQNRSGITCRAGE